VILHPAAFGSIAAVVIVTPGPDTVLTVRNALLGGRRGGVCTAAGVCAGQTAWALMAAVGVATVIAASRPAFLLVKLLGAGYLVILGSRSLRGTAGGSPATWESLGARPTAAAALRQGAVSNLANPKMALFFVGVLPTFTSPRGGRFAGMLLLALVFSALSFLWLSVYAAVVARLGDLLRRGRIRRLLDIAAGATLVALGLRVATE
jgi:threonine/homoserine/homoserine lactone efflux protein